MTISRQLVSFYSASSTDRLWSIVQPRCLSKVSRRSRLRRSLPESWLGRRLPPPLASRRPVVARQMVGPAEDPALESQRNSNQHYHQRLVVSLAPELHLRLAIAQSQEQLASKHFGLPQALAKIRGRQRERRSILPRETGARFRQSTPGTGLGQRRRRQR